MFDAVVQHTIATELLFRMRTNDSIRNEHEAMYNLHVSCSSHEKTFIQRDSGVCIFLEIGCRSRV